MRLKEIDFLRGIAIILVLLHHYNIFDILHQIGWIGVDLFFVLSGFLVSGLLFNEFNKTSKIKPGLFIIRRGFKIYPSFYFLLLISFILDFVFKNLDKKQYLRYLCEITFTQNYTSAVWGQTWSLAVEEHFYILLILLFMVYLKNKKTFSLKEITYFCFTIFLFCLSLRYLTYYFHPDYSFRRNHFPTHLRLDSLLFGVLLSANYHLNRSRFLHFFTRNTRSLLALSFLCISIAFFYKVDSYVINTIGFTLLYLGFGILLAIFVANKSVVERLKKTISKPVFNIVAWIGVYSYTIYLFHMLILTYLEKLIIVPNGNKTMHYTFFSIFVLISVVTGFLVSKTIEFPFLRIREKYFSKNDNVIN